MKCLRCSEEMKHYPLTSYIGVHGAAHKHLGTIQEDEHGPRSIYSCDKCGYMELSRNECEKPDI